MTQIFLYLKYNLQQHKYAKASPSQQKKEVSNKKKVKDTCCDAHI